MKMQNKKKMLIVVFAALVLCVVAGHAQDNKEDSRSVNPAAPLSFPSSGGNADFGKRPVPAARGVESQYDAQLYDPAQVEPDTNTLSGAEVFGVGSLQHARSLFDPSITISSLGQSGTTGLVGQSGLYATNILGGALNFSRIWSRYRLATIYNGGETIHQGPLPNSSFHNLAFAQDVEWRRWRLHLRDDFTAAPGASFAGSGMGGPGLLGQFSSPLSGALNSIGQRFLPSETIQTGQAMRYANTVLGQAEYSFTRRSAFTLSGSYGLLHFTTPGFVSSHMLNVQGGYDYQLDSKNSIAALARYSKIDYTGTATPTEGYTTELAYGRKITGQLAFQVAGGPQQIRFSTPTSGSSRNLTWVVNSALTYERRRSGLSLDYARGLTGGSGVFVGAKSDTFTGTVHHQFTRFWSGSVNGGYAFDRSLVAPTVGTSTFDNWFIGANMGRQVGRHAQVGFNYGLQKQDNPAVCPVTSCGPTGFQETFGVTVNWHLRPVE
jgi:hypothetical protein